ncbi:sensor histidine kinase [Limisalsivibrio acetivorans]|uniref:sensor histidine kinase n=1 Tax=Limisalsivibrio acetivorans TaxID=1304888 RepID=UPI0003B78F4A|nr:sensor histidine kinase [Limisalsivibrio acetivorans]
MRIYIKLFSFIIIPVLIITGVMFYIFQNKMMENAEEELLTELKNKWVILENSGLLSMPLEESHERLRRISSQSSLRITLINMDGIVLDDSYMDFNEVVKLDNHLRRPEIRKAMKSGEGIEKRFSTSTGERMIYYAKRMDNGEYILRLSYPMRYVEILKDRVREHTYLSFVLLLVVLMAVLFYISLRVSRPVVKLSRIVNEIEKGSMPDFPIFKSRIMHKVASLIYRTYHALENQKSVLRDEKKELNELVNLLEEGIIKMDAEGGVLIANESSQKILQSSIEPGDKILDRVTDMDSIVFIKDVLSTETDTSKIYEMKDGVFEVYIRILEKSRIAVFQDITDSERYERYKNELITNISHELKTPLALAMGYAETLANHKEMKEEDRERFTNKILSSANQLNNIINDVIELHRYENMDSRHRGEREGINLSEFTEELKEYYKDKFPTGVRFESPDKEVLFNRAHLSSLLTNLIDNAISYSGGDYIGVAMDYNGESLVIEVSDGGPPIPKAERKRIFERFYTVSKSRNKNKSSTGLGLSIVKHICRLYDGNIYHEENDRGGNTFRVSVLLHEYS